LAWEPGVGWATDPPTSGFAEASLSVPSDFDVTFTVPEGRGLRVLATGVADSPTHWRAVAAGDWAVSVGRFTTASATAVGGQVQVTVGVDAQVAESPDGYLAKIVAALDRYSALYGAYPWPAFTMAVEPGLRGGIEYPMHVMQGPGTGGRTTAHEVGHMWFFGLVPNDQGRDPWLDEGLATWLEGRFEGTTAALLAEAIPPDGAGRAGLPMTYWEPRQSIYYRSVYVQGAQAVGALGPPAVVDCALRHLVARQAFSVTTDAAAIAALSEVVPDAGAILARYGIPPR
ncbi:MAG TPA: hypothetical protein VHN98_13295, partial [Acidimicrobiales bacterium]|nr:hypothetical protein [Acidimicrobiales bacterium]